ncbi:MAG TPA: integrase arm-type DNA-binding domain-containing protein [Steroidobacteraceae bacterium]|jgi:integrase|nr:integrase arm-type DNA-binding domain-containing protein [Steroidobacteraceae bacterium]
MSKLTDTRIQAGIRRAQATQKPVALYDTEGLWIHITPAGKAFWRFSYRCAGPGKKIEKLISLGEYGSQADQLSLAEARDERGNQRKLVREGKDPSAEKKAKEAARMQQLAEEKAAAETAERETMKAISLAWLEEEGKPDSKGNVRITAGTLRRHRRRLESFVFPYLGDRPIRSVTSKELLEVLQKIEEKGKIETARRVLQLCEAIWRSAVIAEKAQGDIASPLRKELKTPHKVSLAAIVEPRRIGQLLRDIDTYVGQPAVTFALKLAPFLFVRPGTLRHAEWSEFDLDHPTAPVWRIPSKKMKVKGKGDHIVPLAPQVVTLLRELHRHTGTGRYLFPSIRSASRPISENTLGVALKTMGYAGNVHTAHGFRSMASTRLNELDYNRDVIELALAHRSNDVRSIYNRSERIPERTALMAAWADELDGLRANKRDNVVAIRRSA